MKHTEKELQALKEEVRQMWKLVLSQLEKSKLSGKILAKDNIVEEIVFYIDAKVLKHGGKVENSK